MAARWQDQPGCRPVSISVPDREDIASFAYLELFMVIAADADDDNLLFFAVCIVSFIYDRLKH